MFDHFSLFSVSSFAPWSFHSFPSSIVWLHIYISIYIYNRKELVIYILAHKCSFHRIDRHVFLCQPVIHLVKPIQVNQCHLTHVGLDRQRKLNRQHDEQPCQHRHNVHATKRNHSQIFFIINMQDNNQSIHHSVHDVQH